MGNNKKRKHTVYGLCYLCKSETFEFRNTWPQEFRIKDCEPVIPFEEGPVSFGPGRVVVSFAT